MIPRSNDGTRLIALVLALGLVVLSMTGCATVRIEAEHISHPGAGWPFGPCDEEAQITQLNALLHWQRNGWYADAGVGVKVYERSQWGFVGPSVTGTVRVGYELVLR